MPQVSLSSRKLKLLTLQKKLKPLRIAVICGGNSSERKISLRSGKAVHQALKRSGLAAIRLDPSRAGFTGKLSQVDAAFLTLHGKGGEDGVIQRVLERHRVPYIGSNSARSRLAFDKTSAKKVFTQSGIPTADYAMVSLSNWKKRLSAMSTPLFLKPPKEGSSIGAFPVEDLAKSAVKITQALRRYKVLMAEQKIEGREFTVGVLGDRALPVIELRPKSRFYDYHSKYTKGMTEYLVPAPITKRESETLRKIALKAHRVLGMRDLSRVDIMTDKAGRPFVLEVNSLPGFTELSLLPKAARAVGISFEELCCRLIDMALQRKNFRRKHG